VNTVLQTHPLNYDIGMGSDNNSARINLEKAPVDPIPSLDIGNVFTPDRVGVLERWADDFDFGASNPFSITRRFYYREPGRDPNRDQDGRQQEALVRLLERFGSEVWHCKYILNPTTIHCPSELYLKIKKLLTLLPNLRTFSIFRDSEVHVSHVFRNTATTGLGKLMRDNPFPQMKHLVSFSIDAGYSGNIVVECEMLPRFPNLKKVYYASWLGLGYFDLLSPTKDLCKVQQLHAVINNAKDFARLSKFGYPLRALTLDCSRYSGKLDRVFEAVAHFGDTLKSFTLNLLSEKNQFTNGLVRFVLNLPKLETLRIHASCSNFRNVDFLLPCSSLKHLKMLVKGGKKRATATATKRSRGGVGSRWGQPVEINVAGLEDSLYMSNLWEKLPQLITVGLDVKLEEGVNGATPGTQKYRYTKEGYLGFQEKQRLNEPIRKQARKEL